MRHFLAIAVFCFSLFPSVVMAQEAFNHTSAKQAILMDYDTGMVLFAKNADEKMPTSSMSKTMTMYVVFKALKEGRIQLDTELQVSEKAWKKGGSKMFVEVNDRVKVEDLIQGVIVQSGNDATIVLAEGLSGSEDGFADALNTTAAELGMTNSHFMNASGWPDPDHYSTAHDLAMLAHHLISDFPEYYHYFAEQEFTYNNIKQPNRNPLLYRNIGADGLKTGHTEAGGYGLMASGTRNDRRVILVVNGLAHAKARAQEGARLLEWGLSGFENVSLFNSGDIVGEATVAMGKKGAVPLRVQEEVAITIPKTVKNDLKVEIAYDGPVVAPIRKGTQIRVLKVSVPRVSDFEVPLYAAEDVETLGFFAMTIEKIKTKLGN